MALTFEEQGPQRDAQKRDMPPDIYLPPPLPLFSFNDQAGTSVVDAAWLEPRLGHPSLKVLDASLCVASEFAGPPFVPPCLLLPPCRLGHPSLKVLDASLCVRQTCFDGVYWRKAPEVIGVVSRSDSFACALVPAFCWAVYVFDVHDRNDRKAMHMIHIHGIYHVLAFLSILNGR